jgi:hypothetical protein
MPLAAEFWRKIPVDSALSLVGWGEAEIFSGLPGFLTQSCEAESEYVVAGEEAGTTFGKSQPVLPTRLTGTTDDDAAEHHRSGSTGMIVYQTTLGAPDNEQVDVPKRLTFQLDEVIPRAAGQGRPRPAPPEAWPPRKLRRLFQKVPGLQYAYRYVRKQQQRAL